MSKKLFLTITLILCLSATMTTPAAAKSYLAERYDVSLSIQPDGALIVTETIIFRFEGGPFTYVFRDLDYDNLDEIDRLQVSMDGQPLSQGAAAGQAEIVAGNPLKVTWHFAPTSDSRHTFTLVYRVQGGIRHNAASDSLLWIAIPEEHDYTIQRSAIRLEYPSGVRPLSAPTIEGMPAVLETGGQAAIVNLEDIGEDTPVVLSVQFPSGSLVSQPPGWQLQQERQASQRAAALPYGFGAAAITGLLSLAGLFMLGMRFRRDTASLPAAPQMYTTPPRQVPPALAARLTGSATGFLGALFDLAQRDVVAIEEGKRQWGSRSFEIVRLPNQEPLQAHEDALLQALFRKAKGDRAPLTSLAVITSDSRFSLALDEEMTDAGWRDAERSAQRGRFLAITVLGLFMGLIAVLAGLLVGGLSLFGGAQSTLSGALLIGAGAALSIAGLVGIFIAASISTLTEEGLRQAAAWKSFTGHLHSIARGREPATSPDTFERYLPYAAAFGLGTVWGKFFEKMGDVPLPEWMHAVRGGLEDGSFAAVMAVISSADSSAASAAAGAAGASGGGASGAG